MFRALKQRHLIRSSQPRRQAIRDVAASWIINTRVSGAETFLQCLFEYQCIVLIWKSARRNLQASLRSQPRLDTCFIGAGPHPLLTHRVICQTDTSLNGTIFPIGVVPDLLMTVLTNRPLPTAMTQLRRWLTSSNRPSILATRPPVQTEVGGNSPTVPQWRNCSPRYKKSYESVPIASQSTVVFTRPNK